MATFLLTQGSGGRKIKAQGNVGQNRGLLTQGPPMKGWNVSLSGVAGNFVSAPHAPSQTPPGDLNVSVYAVANNWALGTDQILFSKFFSTTNGVFRLFIDSAPLPGVLSLVTTDGTTADTAICTSSIQTITGVANGEGLWLGAEFQSGAGGTVDFYYSKDSPTMDPETIEWYTLQLNRSTTPTILGAGNTASPMIGAYGDGTVFPFGGKIYRAVAHSSLAETPANRIIDFNPAEADGNTSWISKSTGELWTLNGTASISYS